MPWRHGGACLLRFEDPEARYGACLLRFWPLFVIFLDHRGIENNLHCIHCSQSTTLLQSHEPSSSQPHSATVIVGDKPNQPSDISFYPVQNTGSLCKNGDPKLRFMNINWYKQYSWLHWDVLSQKLFCFICCRAKQRNVFVSHRKLYDPAFIENGFCDWKNAVRAFERHDKCDCHREAVGGLESLSRTSVSAQLDRQLARDQQVASKALSVIISTLKYLARQGLAVRGHSETSGNFHQLLRARSCDVPELAAFMQRRNCFLSHEIQNEILEMMAHDVLRSIIRDVTHSKS